MWLIKRKGVLYVYQITGSQTIRCLYLSAYRKENGKTSSRIYKKLGKFNDLLLSSPATRKADSWAREEARKEGALQSASAGSQLIFLTRIPLKGTLLSYRIFSSNASAQRFAWIRSAERSKAAKRAFSHDLTKILSKLGQPLRHDVVVSDTSNRHDIYLLLPARRGHLSSLPTTGSTEKSHHALLEEAKRRRSAGYVKDLFPPVRILDTRYEPFIRHFNTIRTRSFRSLQDPSPRSKLGSTKARTLKQPLPA